jgi:hypothetical protein
LKKSKFEEVKELKSKIEEIKDFRKLKNWSQKFKKSKIKEIEDFKKSKLYKVEDWNIWRWMKIWSLETQPESATQVDSRGLLTWVCPSGTHGLVYWVRPIKEVDRHKDSKIDLETKKESSNTYSTRTLVNLSLVAYIKPGWGASRETTYNLDIERQDRLEID